MNIFRNVAVFIIAAAAFYGGLMGGEYVQTHHLTFLRESFGEPRHIAGLTLDMVSLFPYFLAFVCFICTALWVGNGLDALLARQRPKK